MEEMDALQRINEVLNNIPTKATTTERHRRVTFESTAKPPQETQPAAPRVANDMPNPRVIETTPTPRVANETPTPRKKAAEHTPERARLKDYLGSASNSRARIPQRSRMNTSRHNPTERIQLVFDPDTGEYLNYRQLM